MPFEEQSPIRTTADAAGGVLQIQGHEAEVLVRATLQLPGAANLVTWELTDTKETRWDVVEGASDPDWVEEEGEKKLGGGEFSSGTGTTAKLALIIPFTKEVIKRSRVNPEALLKPIVNQNFAMQIDAQIIGYRRGAKITIEANKKFDSRLVEDVAAIGQVVSLVGGYQHNDPATYRGDRLQTAVEEATGVVEENGISVNGLVLSFSAKSEVRMARRGGTGQGITTDRLYPGGVSDAFPDLQVEFSTNLPSLRDEPAEGKVVGIVGNFNYLKGRVLTELSVDRSGHATLIKGATGSQTLKAENVVSLWQRNMVATLWEMECGCTNLEPRAFCLILDEPQTDPDA